MNGTINRAHWYSVKQVATLLQVDPESVRRWIRAGEIETHYLGRGRLGGYRVDHEALERFIKRRYPNLKLDLDEE